jgi:hypothetical protein
LYRDLLNDPAFINLTPASRFLYVGLVHLANESGNKVYNDRTWIGQRLYMDRTEVDLTPLYKSKLLETSNLRRLLRERGERDREREGEESADAPPTPKVQKLTDEEWLVGLKKNPAYQHIDLPVELGKMDAWLAERPGRQKTRRFVLNWLNKIEKPMKVVPLRPAQPVRTTIVLGPNDPVPVGEPCPPEVADILSKLTGKIGSM